mmetsp:Transcript_1728/g.2709  ORF Transcript_1728/g.2709 Transcript_1728/m.2709 type:complete len:182 (-) Transcript_1728:76-621(-)
MSQMLRLFVLLAFLSTGVQSESNADDENTNFARNYLQQYPSTKVLPSGLHIRIIRSGEEPRKYPSPNSPCRCRYVGKTITGHVFGESGEEPSVFVPKDVIKGIGEALQLMSEGDVWELVVPGNIGYGGSTLVFELELLEVGEEKTGFEFSYAMQSLICLAVIGIIYIAYKKYGTSNKAHHA